ncbi:sulfotransferase family protein [Nocardioides speluncae]|uniref:sulfotransferase family protein n=1 Tax=Nocardioides speluncae TaxID=2670337 RepID=UPI000D69563B|nr:sulfotransferase family protein [Nocardioides speluncae]
MVKVIGAGLGRTGTDSVKAALELLGFGPCHHMKELFANPSSIRGWLDAATGRQTDWHQLLAGYGSALDWPSASFWRELASAYPHARVLLTVRDPQRWYDSVADTLYRTRYQSTAEMPPALRARFEATPELQDQLALTERLIWQGLFAGRFSDRDFATGAYQAHLAAVRDAVPAPRLLEFEVTQGWEPLCAFLEVEVPDEPFPWLNTSADYTQRS